MNILITGDSWGVPWYDKITNEPTKMFEYHIKGLGYNTYNSALKGGSNLEAIDRSIRLLSGGSILHPSSKFDKDHVRYTTRPDVTLSHIPKIDWIIWFHTEFGRDWFRDVYLEDIRPSNIAKETYTRFFELKNSIGANAIVIGGQSPVFPTFTDYGSVELSIPDWRSDLLCKNTAVKNIFDSKRARLRGTEDQKYEQWINDPDLGRFIRESPDFPDNSHPSDDAYKELAAQLHEFIQNNASETG